MLLWDSLNEEALKLTVQLLSHLGKHGSVKIVYERFAAEYLSIYDKHYPHTMKELLAAK